MHTLSSPPSALAGDGAVCFGTTVGAVSGGGGKSALAGGGWGIVVAGGKGGNIGIFAGGKG